MLFKECLDIPCGLRFMFDQLQLQSSCGRSRMLNASMMLSRQDIEASYSVLRNCYSRLYKQTGGNASSSLAALKHRLMCLRDISGTIERLQKNLVLDDVDLFDIRENLSSMLLGHIAEIKGAIDAISDLDILLAKCLQIKIMGLCLPSIAEDCTTEYKGLFHPYIVHVYESQAALGGKKKTFQPVDLSFGLESVTIIGANMGGKSVVLKMAALNQLLFQFGFGVAAREAAIDIKEDIRVCIGDDQDLSSGLSSFAGEVKAIDNVIRGVRSGSRLLALIDEPARTTNPIEGTALVEALLNILKDRNISVLMTTHYNVPGDFFRRLKVRGLSDGKMDYTLTETAEGEIPHEAISVARSLGVDPEWLDAAESVLKDK